MQDPSLSQASTVPFHSPHPPDDSSLQLDEDLSLFYPTSTPRNVHFSPSKSQLPEPSPLQTSPTEPIPTSSSSVDVTRLHDQLSEAQVQIAHLESLLDKEKTDKERLESFHALQINQANLKLKHSEAQNSRLLEKITSLTNTAEKNKIDAEKFFAKCTKKLPSSIGKADVCFLIEAFQSERIEKDERIRDLEAENLELSQALRQAENFEISGNDSLVKKRGDLETRIAQLTRELTSKDQEIKNLKEEGSKFRSEISGLEQLLNQKEKEFNLKVEALTAELMGRPTNKEFNELVNKLNETENKLKETIKEELITEHDFPKGEGEARHQIKVDKKAHKLGVLDQIQRESKKSLINFAKEICTLVSVTNLSEALVAVKKMIDLMSFSLKTEEFLSKLLNLINTQVACSPSPHVMYQKLTELFNQFDDQNRVIEDVIELVAGVKPQVSIDNLIDCLYDVIYESETETYSPTQLETQIMNLFDINERSFILSKLNSIYLKLQEYSNVFHNFKRYLNLKENSSLKDVESGLARIVSMVGNVGFSHDDVATGQNSVEFERLGRETCRLFDCDSSRVFGKLKDLIRQLHQIRQENEEFSTVLDHLRTLLKVNSISDLEKSIIGLLER
ncbi:hypothetical protein P9112_009348 [Eukaryota sp. TZLM1-RC]